MEDISQAEDVEVEVDPEEARIETLRKFMADKRQAVRESRAFKITAQNKIMEICKLQSSVKGDIETIRRKLVQGPGLTVRDMNRLNLMYTAKRCLEDEEKALRGPVITVGKWIQRDRQELEKAKIELKDLVARKYGDEPSTGENVVAAEEDALEM